MPGTTPKNLIRTMGGDIQVDVENRILRSVEFVTHCIASDGGIVLPRGIMVQTYETNPVVMAKHGIAKEDLRSPVIGRSLSLRVTARGMVAEMQFADTELGREYAYLYGCNDKQEVYARAWSFGWNTLEVEWWDLDRAQRELGSDYDAELLPPFVLERREVWAATKSLMNEYSAVSIGADRKALSRAYQEQNIRLAGELVTAIDLESATRMIADLRTTQEADRSRLDKLEQNILALSRDGASAAARGDTDEIVTALSGMLEGLRQRRKERGK